MRAENGNAKKLELGWRFGAKEKDASPDGQRHGPISGNLMIKDM